MKEFIEKLFTLYAQGFYDSYGSVWQAVTKDNFTKALKQAYNQGVEDAIKVCDTAIETDFTGALRNRVWIRFSIQQLKKEK